MSSSGGRGAKGRGRGTTPNGAAGRGRGRGQVEPSLHQQIIPPLPQPATSSQTMRNSK